MSCVAVFSAVLHGSCRW